MGLRRETPPERAQRELRNALDAVREKARDALSLGATEGDIVRAAIGDGRWEGDRVVQHFELPPAPRPQGNLRGSAAPTTATPPPPPRTPRRNKPEPSR